MKATIDVPDELYRRVKARSALLGRAVREVTIELYQRWLGELPVTTPARSPEQWLDDWLQLGDSLLQHAPEGPTATDILAADRNRTEPR
ncbi:MAG: hypothetical protein ACR2G6_09320 [Gemmatimonadaceae bacterium]